MNHLTLLLLATLRLGAAGLRSMRTEFKWKTIEYEYLNKAHRAELIRKGYFIPGNAWPCDVDRSTDGRLFLTVPKIQKGIPVSLTYIPVSADGPSPALRPYPNWASHNVNYDDHDCSRITSVTYCKVDECDRLWAVDSGAVNTLKKFRSKCPQRLLVYDLKTNTLLFNYKFPKGVVKSNSLLTTVVVDTPSSPTGCAHSTAYIADSRTHALIACRPQDNRSWRMESEHFRPDPRWSFFNVAGKKYYKADGITGLACSPQASSNGLGTTLYFHALASDREGRVAKGVTGRPENFPNNTNTVPGEFRQFKGRRSSQSAGEIMDGSGVLFFGDLKRNCIYCWNSKRRYSESNFARVECDDERLQYVNALKVYRPLGGDPRLMAIASRFHKVITGTMDNSEYNYRIVTGSIADLVGGTKCDPKRNPTEPESEELESGEEVGNSTDSNRHTQQFKCECNCC